MALVPVAAATAVQFVVGGLWYGPLFGQLFLRLAYRHKQPLGSLALGLVGSITGAVIMSSVLYDLHYHYASHASRNIAPPFVYLRFCDQKGFTALKLAAPATPLAAVTVGLTLSSVCAGAALTHTFWENRPLALTILHEVYHATVLSANAWMLHRFFL